MGLFFTANVLAQLAAAAAMLEEDPDRADRAWGEAEDAMTSLGRFVDDDTASFVIGGANFHRAMRRIDEDGHRVGLSRWMAEHRAEGSFTAGLVAVDEHAKALQPALVAVTPDAFVFVDEDGDEGRHGEMVELGRFRRDTVKGVDVLDEHDGQLPEPWDESIDEPERLCRLVVSWVDEGEQAQTDEFLFRSASVAWDAAHRFRRFAIPPLDAAPKLPAPQPTP